MKTINLINPKNGDVNFKVFTFPDGEPHVVLDEIDRKDDYVIQCRISNPSDLFILLQVCDILDRQCVFYTINIYYLMSMRMDRVISFNEAFSLRMVCNMLNNLENCKGIEILEPHSYRTLEELNLGEGMINVFFEKIYNVSINNTIFVLPDNGAFERYIDSLIDQEYIVCSKVRNPITGALTSFNILEDTTENDFPLLVIDDLCDGGGTFAGIAKLLREKYPNRKLNIFVTHMVNPKGIKTLSENYDHVTFTNSYKDWQDEVLPENVDVIKII